MRIGGLNSFSLSDFPGHMAAVIFTQQCNFRCPFCHNGSLIPREPADGKLILEAEILHLLERRRNQLDGVVISGGEPTLQSDLIDFVARIKNMGLAVTLDTNGSQPDILKDLLKKEFIDYIAMDIKAPWHKYEYLTGVRTSIAQLQKSITLIANSRIDHEFRTTVVGPLLSSEDVEMIRGLIPAGSRYRTQKFRPENALDPVLRNGITTDRKDIR